MQVVGAHHQLYAPVRLSRFRGDVLDVDAGAHSTFGLSLQTGQVSGPCLWEDEHTRQPALHGLKCNGAF